MLSITGGKWALFKELYVLLDQNKGVEEQSEMNSERKGGMQVCIILLKVIFRVFLIINLTYFYFDVVQENAYNYYLCFRQLIYLIQGLNTSEV